MPIRRIRRSRASIALFATLLVVTPLVMIPAHGALGQTATEVRDALDIPTGDFVGASFGGSDPDGSLVFTDSLGGFPTAGGSFLVLSTGDAADADTPDDSGSLSTVLGGSDNSQGNDLVQLQVDLTTPAGATCVAFDFAFFSEEFPEFVGSSFNDAFTAEMGQTDLTIVNNQVVAPFNFAFDTDGNPISVNTVFGFTLGTGTTYDGVTPLLTAQAPVEVDVNTGQVHLYFTIQDLGDSVYDSAVFIDNFRWLFNVDCTPGSSAFIDTDGDALPDDWETNGVDFDSDGTIDLDLPAMGADPNHKDIFIEIDYMVDPPAFCIFGVCFGGHSHRPKTAALTAVINAFANAPVTNPDGVNGITMHIDAGPGTVMDPPSGATWGALSESDVLAHQNNVGTFAGGLYDWSAFDVIKDASFELSRADVFHYAIFAHNYGGGTSSGISRGIPASDFIVSLGSFSETVQEQAGTLMHEFGHNLGLFHGGDENVNRKPNYLSIMSYSWQLTGLLVGSSFGTVDYSFVDLDDLNESTLDETIGLTPTAPIAGYGTIYFCGGVTTQVNNATGPIDWNCDGSNTTGVAQNINNSGGLTTLTGFDDWDNIRFDGGAVGQLGAELPTETEANEEPAEVFFEEGLVLTDFNVLVDGPPAAVLVAGTGPQLVQFKVTNGGENDDTYDLAAATNVAFADLSSVPASVAVAAGDSVEVIVPVNVPGGTAAGPLGEISLSATSTANPALSDEATSSLAVIEVDASISGDLLAALIDGLQALADSEPDIARKLQQAIGDLQDAAAALAQEPPDRKTAVNRLEKALGKLQQASADAGKVLDDPATVQEQLAGAEVLIAQISGAQAATALDEAAFGGGDPDLIAEGLVQLAKGDAAFDAGAMHRATTFYKTAANLAAESLGG